MGTVSLFFDTYAFFEILKNNPNYRDFTQNFGIATTRLNLMELYYGLLKNYNKNLADYLYDFLIKYVIEIDDGIVKEAMRFKLQHRSKRLSYVDCIGYIAAMKHNIKFLTGDRQFKELPNVEFVV